MASRQGVATVSGALTTGPTPMKQLNWWRGLWRVWVIRYGGLGSMDILEERPAMLD